MRRPVHSTRFARESFPPVLFVAFAVGITGSCVDLVFTPATRKKKFNSARLSRNTCTLCTNLAYKDGPTVNEPFLGRIPGFLSADGVWVALPKLLHAD